MIKANELRIGNYLTAGGGPIMVDAICDYANPKFKLVSAKSETMGVELPFDAFDPIPLTPEILEKSGFTEDRIGRYCLERLTISKDSCWWYSIDCTDYDGDTGTVLTEITQLHQLQNLYFSLTGEELDIKL